MHYRDALPRCSLPKAKPTVQIKKERAKRKEEKYFIGVR